MQIRDNFGRLIGEINVIIRPGQGVITTNTVYLGERVIACWRRFRREPLSPV